MKSLERFVDIHKPQKIYANSLNCKDHKFLAVCGPQVFRDMLDIMSDSEVSTENARLHAVRQAIAKNKAR